MADVSKYIERAEGEVKRRNFDHAITLYLEILKIDPDCGAARSGVRRAALRKFEKQYPSVVHRGVINLPTRIALAFARLFRAREGIVSLCEAALKRDPRNPKLNHLLGHTLLHLGHRRSAQAAFEVVAEFDPKDISSLKTLGELAYESKDLERALDCFEKALKINPRDQDAARMRKNLAAEGAIKKGGFESAKSARELAKSQRQLKETERAQKIVRTQEEVREAIAEAEEQLAEKPENIKLLIQLGNLQIQARDMDAGVDAYMAALKLEPDNVEALERLGDARIRRLELRVQEAEKAAAEDESAKGRVAGLREELRALQVEEFTRRVALYPTDMGLRFRLGRVLLADGRTDEAIEQFQQAVRDPKHRLRALHLLGRAFAGKGMTDLALKQYAEALGGLPAMTDQRKEILYELAHVHEQSGDPAQAISIYKEIYESDISYRDVGRRIEALGA